MQKLWLLWGYSHNMAAQSTHTLILTFDSPSLKNVDAITKLVSILDSSIREPKSAFLVCGAFADSDNTLINTLSFDTTHATPYKESEGLSKLVRIHMDTIHHIARICKSEDKEPIEHAKTHIRHIAQNITSLLKGIYYVKEISPRTITLIVSYVSQLCAVLIQCYIRCKYNIVVPFAKSYMDTEVLAHNNLAIIPLSHTHNTNIDYVAAFLATQYHASNLSVWTSRSHVMTANPKIIPHAKLISSIDYTTALEIAYLGGKILHPTSITLLQESHIPIHIFSSYDEPYLSVIQDDMTDSAPKCITITERSHFTVLSVRSAKMFGASGYLEKIFKVFSQNNVPVETLTTSEISVTLTFPTHYFSDTLVDDLSSLGTPKYTHEQAIISIIGNAYWSSSQNISHMLATIPKEVRINALSLGKSGTNLSIVLHKDKLANTIHALHAHLFE